ncbi:MAG: helix-turn-helix domain-containing protein, partial [Anaerolineaceae bacterium]|nr:helix-turn-helix domain-containing protein [Anaerolineaceae bacterium]
MRIHRGYKTKLDLTEQQRQTCIRHAGAARYAYNFGLARKLEAYRSGQKVPTAIDLHRELNALKKSELAWMYEVSKCAGQEALRDLDRGCKNYFRGLDENKAGKKTKVGYPRFKSRKKGIG